MGCNTLFMKKIICYVLILSFFGCSSSRFLVTKEEFVEEITSIKNSGVVYIYHNNIKEDIYLKSIDSSKVIYYSNDLWDHKELQLSEIDSVMISGYIGFPYGAYSAPAVGSILGFAFGSGGGFWSTLLNTVGGGAVGVLGMFFLAWFPSPIGTIDSHKYIIQK